MSDLEAALERCRAFLEGVGETFWSERIAKALRTCHGSDVALSRIVRSWTGGMGAFNDLTIHPLNGHDVRPEDTRQMHDQFDGLRTAVYHYLLPRR